MIKTENIKKQRSNKEDHRLPKGWELKKLVEVCEIINGGTPKSNIKEYWNGDINWVTPKDLGQLKYRYIENTPRKITKLGLQKSSAKLFGHGAVILSTRAPIGHLAINLKEMSTNQGCRGIVPGTNVFNEFLYYFLFNSIEILNNLGNGATFKELSSTSLKNFNIPLPSLSEQKRIVAILDEAFAAIDKAKANAEKNLANAKELFESYLNGIFANPGEDWEEKRLSEISRCITDGDHMPPPKSDHGIPFITISNINKNTNQINFIDTFFVPLEYYRSLKENRKPRKGDILYTVTGSYGIPVLIDFDSEFCFQRHIGLIRPKEEVNPKLLYYWILSSKCKNQANTLATGTAQKTVSLGILRNFLVPLIKEKEQNEIVNSLDLLASQTKQLESIYQQKITALDELKKSILKKAFEGKL